MFYCYFFFFKQKTAYEMRISDWSSDVCSSDLIFGGQTHSQSPEGIFTHVSGLKTVMPSNPYDAKGLLTASIEDDDPVVFFEPKRLYNGPFDGHHDRPLKSWAGHPAAEVPEGYYRIELGTASIVRPGQDVTVLRSEEHTSE